MPWPKARPAPTSVWVAYCTTCGWAQGAEGTQARAKRWTSCAFCPVAGGGGFMAVARYQLAPQKERNGRKPRKKWKR